MERAIQKIDSAHSEMCFTMQGITEREEWLRVFPEPLPSTHRIAIRWDGMKLYVRPELIQQPAPAHPLGTGEGTAQVDHVADLSKLNKEDLLTEAAVKYGLTLDKNLTKPQMVAAITDEIAKRNGAGTAK